ncbi:MAG: 30S ribosomal protein S13 [Patescibacteria group bacterium]|nr:30S ribosomal protein S13 [Patescibacteria group bacterium]
MAARLAGVTLPQNKRVEIGLTYIYGVGRPLAKKILDVTGINPDTRTQDLTEEQIKKINDFINKNYRVEGELKRDRFSNVKRLKEIGCYRGTRHAKGLPVRGQRTKTNNRTVRGNIRHTMGSGRRPSAEKT